MAITLRNCVFAFKCPKDWDSLVRTKVEGVRFCRTCEREVYYCDTDVQLVEAIKWNRCVAILDPSETRFTMGVLASDEEDGIAF